MHYTKFATVMDDDDIVIPESTEVTLEGNRQTHYSFDPLLPLLVRSFMGENGSEKQKTKKTNLSYFASK